MAVVWNYPTRMVFGEGAASEVVSECKRLRASRALIVTDAGVVNAGLVERVTAPLSKAGIAFEIYAGVIGNPGAEPPAAATAAFKATKADIVIAIGGGSPIDVAKIVRICAVHDGPLADYDDAKNGSDKIVNPMPPMIAIPTTAGTGSEVGRSGVVTMAATGKKTIFFAPALIPSVAILDPIMTASMPPHITAATGFDALTHSIEALCTNFHHPMAEAIALTSIELIVDHLVTAVNQGSNLTARGAMLQAAAFGAVAFQKGLGACHSLAHPLSTETDMHHGLANALCLPAVLDFNRHVAQPKLAKVARLFGVHADSEETLAFECSGAVRDLRKQVGLPNGLKAAGIKEEQLPHLADLAFADVCHQENPRPCRREDLFAMYQASL